MPAASRAARFQSNCLPDNLVRMITRFAMYALLTRVLLLCLWNRVAAYCVNESSVVWIDEYQPSIIGTFVNCLIYAQDAMIAPYYTTGQQINVSTELFLNNLIKVDEVTSTVTLDFFFLTYWVSNSLQNLHVLFCPTYLTSKNFLSFHTIDR